MTMETILNWLRLLRKLPPPAVSRLLEKKCAICGECLHITTHKNGESVVVYCPIDRNHITPVNDDFKIKLINGSLKMEPVLQDDAA
jgi:hypothetical protein